MTILGVTNKSRYLHFLLNLAVMLFSVRRETKTHLTQGQCKPRNQGTEVSPSSPASLLLHPRANSASPHRSSWRVGTTGPVEAKVSVSNCWWRCVLFGSL